MQQSNASVPDPSRLAEPLRPPFASYRQRSDDAARALEALDRKSSLLANARGIVFLAGLAVAALTVFGRIPSFGWIILIGLIAAYVVLAVVHGSVIAEEDRARIRRKLNERGIARLTGGWHEFPERGDRFSEGSHLYTPDLDVFGQGSLFQVMDQSATRAGEARLAAWLSQPAPADTVRKRQQAVAELSPLLDFRLSLQVESRILSSEKVEPSGFIAWAEGGPFLRSIRWAVPLAVVLPLLTLFLYIAGRLGWVPRPSFWLGLFAQLGVVLLTRKPLGELYARLSAGEGGFRRFGEVFRIIEGQRFSSPIFEEVLGPLEHGAKERVSQKMSRFSRLLGFAEIRQSGQLHAVLNLLTLWDVHWLFRLEHWRREHGPNVRRWFEALADLEALCSVAGFAHDRPHFTFPEILTGTLEFEAKALGHPLLDDPVPNDVRLEGPRHALLITGSNMSGKTTLLRAMGANTVLALCGAPVCARSMRVPVIHLLTSMRVKDSLERGVSYFYAEVQRIKAVLEAAQRQQGQALFLLDEILMGTNTKERQIASREILRLLLETGAIGAVTTHDLSLAALADEPGIFVRNVHFKDRLENDEMVFDYRMREGVVDSTNALRVLALAGIPVRATTDAMGA